MILEDYNYDLELLLIEYKLHLGLRYSQALSVACLILHRMIFTLL